ncbi:MAG: WYL domain-containing protein, partial [Candidatus Cybelea sp.]
EVRALFASGASPLADLGLERGLTRALEKLRGGLADVHQRAADKSRSRIHLDQRRWNQAEPPLELLTTLRRAVWDDRCLRIRYEDRNGNASARSVDPLGLVCKAGVWYLIARSDGGLRSFRVDRVRSAQEAAQHFERPEDFDLERYWAESSARFAEASRSGDCMVTFYMPNDALERVTYYWPSEVLWQDASEARVRVTFPGREVALFQALAWADVATLVEPVALRDEIVARARHVLTRYALR